MRLLLIALSFLVQEKTAQQDTLLVGIRSKPDSVKSTLYITAAKQYFATPSIADSLGALGFKFAKRSRQLNNQGEGAFIICFANLKVDLSHSQKWGDTAIYYFEKAGNNTWAGYVTRVIGMHAKTIEKNEMALTYLQRSNQYFLRANDTVMLVNNYSTLSLMYHNNLQDYDLGLKYGLDALNLLTLTQSKNLFARWTAINAIAINYDDRKEFDKALEYHFENLKNVGENEGNRATTYNNIGNTYRKQKKFTQAEPYFTKALEFHLKSNNLPGKAYSLATVYNNLSNVNWDLGRADRAKNYRDSAIHYSILSKDTEKLMDTYYDSYVMSEKNKDFKNAVIYLRHYLDIKDSAFTAERAKIVYDLEIQYESQRKQQQIALLQAQATVTDLELQQSKAILISIVGGFILLSGFVYLFYKRSKDKQRLAQIGEREELQRQRFTAVLEAEENERSRVAKELHDGLGQLLSTAKLSLSAIDETPSKETNKLLRNSMSILDEATQEVRDISHNLMPATLTQIGLAAALQDLFTKINESKLLYIKQDIRGLENRLSPTTEIAVYRVVQEIINNMIKHSKADTINVRVVRTASAMELSIADNGVGFENEMIVKSTGLGWKNIFSRISMLNGKIDVDTRPGAGTNVNILFSV